MQSCKIIIFLFAIKYIIYTKIFRDKTAKQAEVDARQRRRELITLAHRHTYIYTNHMLSTNKVGNQSRDTCDPKVTLNQQFECSKAGDSTVYLQKRTEINFPNKEFVCLHFSFDTIKFFLGKLCRRQYKYQKEEDEERIRKLLLSKENFSMICKVNFCVYLIL